MVGDMMRHAVLARAAQKQQKQAQRQAQKMQQKQAKQNRKSRQSSSLASLDYQSESSLSFGMLTDEEPSSSLLEEPLSQSESSSCLSLRSHHNSHFGSSTSNSTGRPTTQEPEYRDLEQRLLFQQQQLQQLHTPSDTDTDHDDHAAALQHAPYGRSHSLSLIMFGRIASVSSMGTSSNSNNSHGNTSAGNNRQLGDPLPKQRSRHSSWSPHRISPNSVADSLYPDEPVQQENGVMIQKTGAQPSKAKSALSPRRKRGLLRSQSSHCQLQDDDDEEEDWTTGSSATESDSSHHSRSSQRRQSQSQHHRRRSSSLSLFGGRGSQPTSKQHHSYDAQHPGVAYYQRLNHSRSHSGSLSSGMKKNDNNDTDGNNKNDNSLRSQSSHGSGTPSFSVVPTSPVPPTTGQKPPQSSSSLPNATTTPIEEEILQERRKTRQARKQQQQVFHRYETATLSEDEEEVWDLTGTAHAAQYPQQQHDSQQDDSLHRFVVQPSHQSQSKTHFPQDPEEFFYSNNDKKKNTSPRDAAYEYEEESSTSSYEDDSIIRQEAPEQQHYFDEAYESTSSYEDDGIGVRVDESGLYRDSDDDDSSWYEETVASEHEQRSPQSNDDDDLVSDIDNLQQHEQDCDAESNSSDDYVEEVEYAAPQLLWNPGGDDESFVRVGEEKKQDDQDDKKDETQRSAYEIDISGFGSYSDEEEPETWEASSTAPKEDETPTSAASSSNDDDGTDTNEMDESSVEYYQEEEDTQWEDTENSNIDDCDENETHQQDESMRNFLRTKEEEASVASDGHSGRGDPNRAQALFPDHAISPVPARNKMAAASLKEFRLEYSSNDNDLHPERRNSAPTIGTSAVVVGDSATKRRQSAPLVMIPMSPLSKNNAAAQRSEAELKELKNFRLLYNNEKEPGSKDENDMSEPVDSSGLQSDSHVESTSPTARSAGRTKSTSTHLPQSKLMDMTDITTTERRDDPTIITTATMGSSADSAIKKGSARALKDFRLAYAASGRDDSKAGSSIFSGSSRSLKDFQTAYYSSSEDDATATGSEYENEAEDSDSNPLFMTRRAQSGSSVVSGGTTHHSKNSSVGPSSSLDCHSSNASSSFKSMASTIISSTSLFSTQLDTSLNNKPVDPLATAWANQQSVPHSSASSRSKNTFPLPIPTQGSKGEQPQQRQNVQQDPRTAVKESDESDTDDEQTFACDEGSLPAESLANHIESNGEERKGKHQKQKSSLDAVSHPSQASQELDVSAIFEPGKGSPRRSKIRNSVASRPQRSRAKTSGQATEKSKKTSSPRQARRRSKTGSSVRSKQKASTKDQPNKNGNCRHRKKNGQGSRANKVHFNQNQSASAVTKSFRCFEENDAPSQLQPEERNFREVNRGSFVMLDESEYSSLRSMFGKGAERVSRNRPGIGFDEDSEEESSRQWNRLEQLLRHGEADSLPGDQAMSSSVDESLGRVSSTHRAKCRYWFSKLYFARVSNDGSKGRRRKAKGKKNGKEDSEDLTDLALQQLSHFYDLPLCQSRKLKSVGNSFRDHSNTETTRSATEFTRSSWTSNYSIKSDDFSTFTYNSTYSETAQLQGEEHTMRGLEDFFCSEVVDNLRTLHVDRILKLQNKHRQFGGSRNPSQEEQDLLDTNLRKLSLQSSRPSRNVARQLAKYDTHEALCAVLSQWKTPAKKKAKKDRKGSKKKPKGGKSKRAPRSKQVFRSKSRGVE